MKHVQGLLLVGITLLLVPAAGSAGFLDKLTKAAHDLTANQNQPSRQNNNQQGTTGGGSLGATSVNTDFPSCIAQTSGVLENLRAQVLRRKLANGKNLSPEERKNMEADAAWLEATSRGARIPAPDPKDSQRYFTEMTDAEQQEITGAYGRYSNEVREKCDYQYGGMSQFGNPDGTPTHAAINTHIPIPDLLHAPPPVEAAKAAAPSHKAQFQSCMASTMTLRWKLFGDKMEEKMHAAHLSPQERKEWMEDLTAVRTAQGGNGMTNPTSPDPRNPSRYMMRLTPEEQMAVNQAYSTQSQEMARSCMSNATATQSAGPAASVSGARSQELAAMHERRRQERASGQKVDVAAVDRDVQEWLAAQPFKPRAYSAGSATQATYLKESGAVECLDRQKGFRAHETLAMLSTKRMSVAMQDRQALEAWISAWGAAERVGQDEAAPVNGKPLGYLKYLANVDQQQINTAYSELHNKIASECESMDYMEVDGKNRQVK